MFKFEFMHIIQIYFFPQDLIRVYMDAVLFVYVLNAEQHNEFTNIVFFPLLENRNSFIR